jgi:enoyl-[acyl-carrier protein] reductase II
MQNRVTKLFDISYPIIQAGMIWCSGWELASAVSNSGALGIIGSGSMYPDVLRDQIRKCKSATNRTFGVNVPLLYPNIDEHINIILEEKSACGFFLCRQSEDLDIYPESRRCKSGSCGF